MEGLANTMNQTNILMHDLKGKSETLTNSLVPRSPVVCTKLGPLPGHSQYSMKKRDQFMIKNELEYLYKGSKF
jgi:hypothetical protein